MILSITENDGTRRIIDLMMVRLSDNSKEIDIWDYYNNHYVIKAFSERDADVCMDKLLNNGTANINGDFFTKR